METETRESSIENNEKEEIESLKRRISGLEAAVARLLEDRKFLQERGLLNKDPDNKQGTYSRNK